MNSRKYMCHAVSQGTSQSKNADKFPDISLEMKGFVNLNAGAKGMVDSSATTLGQS